MTTPLTDKLAAELERWFDSAREIARDWVDFEIEANTLLHLVRQHQAEHSQEVIVETVARAIYCDHYLYVIQGLEEFPYKWPSEEIRNRWRARAKAALATLRDGSATIAPVAAGTAPQPAPASVQLLRVPHTFHTVEEVLETARHLDLPNVLVLSELEDGRLVFLETPMDVSSANYLLDRMKMLLLMPKSFERKEP